MFEQLLEDIAQTNALREVNTSLKLAAGLGALLLSLVSTGYVAPLSIAIVVSGALLLLARIDPYTYGELFVAPVSFALLSVAAIVLISGGSDALWSWQPLPWLSLSITFESINQGLFIFCRTLGGMSALLFIALTTPMTDLFVVMRQCRLPEVLVELVTIVYRTIFILLDQLVQCYHAQVMRLGYSTRRESIRSLATLCGVVFIASWNAGEDLVRARDLRCYDGKLVVLGAVRPVELRPALAVAGFLVVSSILVVLTGKMTIISGIP
ncbi:MAG: cobalt ECF transporter T component CbiQ [Methanospirillum sp.]